MATTTITKKFIPCDQVTPAMIRAGELSMNAAKRLAACFDAEPYLETGSGKWWAMNDGSNGVLDGEIRLTQALAMKLHNFHLNEVLAQPAPTSQP